jgi:hypothetical protein
VQLKKENVLPGIRQGVRADWAGQRASRPAGDWRADVEDRAGWARPQGRFKETLIFQFQLDLDFGKSFRNSTRRFGRDLDMGIFPKFF